jgi:hypothetical protein
MQAVIVADAESMMKKMILVLRHQAEGGPRMMITKAEPEDEPNSEEEAGDQHQ